MYEYKTIICLSDLHCGHYAGLCPPCYAVNKESASTLHRVQVESYTKYKELAFKYYKPDYLFVLGDCIDGKGTKSEGTELFEPDRIKQAEIASYCLKEWNARKIFMVRGTPYHTGQGEDFENIIAKDLNAAIDDVLNVKINNTVFNLRHHIGGGSLEHTKATPLMREYIYNLVMADYQLSDKANVFIRGHVHNYMAVQRSHYHCFTLPALQHAGSKFGKKKCSGSYDWGVLVINLYENGDIEWKAEIIPCMEKVVRIIEA